MKLCAGVSYSFRLNTTFTTLPADASSSTLGVTWSVDSGAAPSPIPHDRFLSVAPDQPLELQVAVNGAPLTPACPSSGTSESGKCADQACIDLPATPCQLEYSLAATPGIQSALFNTVRVNAAAQ